MRRILIALFAAASVGTASLLGSAAPASATLAEQLCVIWGPEGNPEMIKGCLIIKINAGTSLPVPTAG